MPASPLCLATATPSTALKRLALAVAAASFLEIGEAVGQRLAVLVARMLREAVLSERIVKKQGRPKHSRILPRSTQKGRLAGIALDVQRLFVGLELRLGCRALVLGVALTLLRSLGTLLLSAGVSPLLSSSSPLLFFSSLFTLLLFHRFKITQHLRFRRPSCASVKKEKRMER